MSNEVGLIEELRGGNPQAATRALYRTYGAELYGFAASRLGDRGLAEEAVQDIFVRAWRSAGRYDPARGSVRTWLYAIARNALIDVERRRGRWLPTVVCAPDSGESSDPTHQADPIHQADPTEPIEAAMLRYQIKLAISRLTSDHRRIIVMVHFQGLALAEIAALTGLPLGTVKSRLHYATRSLRLALEELEVTP